MDILVITIRATRMGSTTTGPEGVRQPACNIDFECDSRTYRSYHGRNIRTIDNKHDGENPY